MCWRQGACTLQQRGYLELLKGELRNNFGVSTTVLTICVVWKQGVLHRALVDAVRGGIHSLHLVEHHALSCDVILRHNAENHRLAAAWIGEDSCY